VNDIKLDYKNSVYLISYWKNVRFDFPVVQMAYGDSGSWVRFPGKARTYKML